MKRKLIFSIFIIVILIVLLGLNKKEIAASSTSIVENPTTTPFLDSETSSIDLDETNQMIETSQQGATNRSNFVQYKQETERAKKELNDKNTEYVNRVIDKAKYDGGIVTGNTALISTKDLNKQLKEYAKSKGYDDEHAQYLADKYAPVSRAVTLEVIKDDLNTAVEKNNKDQLTIYIADTAGKTDAERNSLASAVSYGNVENVNNAVDNGTYNNVALQSGKNLIDLEDKNLVNSTSVKDLKETDKIYKEATEKQIENMTPEQLEEYNKSLKNLGINADNIVQKSGVEVPSATAGFEAAKSETAQLYEQMKDATFQQVQKIFMEKNPTYGYLFAGDQDIYDMFCNAVDVAAGQDGDIGKSFDNFFKDLEEKKRSNIY